jgi:hypothetical protein
MAKTRIKAREQACKGGKTELPEKAKLTDSKPTSAQKGE